MIDAPRAPPGAAAKLAEALGGQAECVFDDAFGEFDIVTMMELPRRRSGGRGLSR